MAVDPAGWRGSVEEDIEKVRHPDPDPFLSDPVWLIDDLTLSFLTLNN